MPYADRNYARGFLSHRYFPPVVKWLMITNTGIFLLYFILVRAGYPRIFDAFGLVPMLTVERFSIWQLFTYMFLHDPYGVGHILMNMLGLFFFGPQLEMHWGSKRFLKYYLACGVGAGLCVVVANYLVGEAGSRTIGASGAIYGVLLAFGVLFPDEIILFAGIVPIKAKYFVMLLGAIAFLSSFGVDSTNVSHFAHLGGMLWGYLYIRAAGRDLRWHRKPGSPRRSLVDALRQSYYEWRMARAKRKFQAYIGRDRDRDRNRDRRVH